jgi:hypothetical protein
LFLLITAASFASAQTANTATAVVVLNSPAWQDAVIAAQYSYAEGYKFKYILGNEDLRTLVQEVYGLRVSEALLYYKRTSELPALTISLRSVGLSVKAAPYVDHHDLAILLLQKMRPKTVIITRDDFALDAISSTYLARTLGAAMVPSEGTLGPKQDVIDAMRQVGVRRVIVVGNIEETRMRQLADLDVTFIRGRDEFETTRKVNEFAFKIKPPGSQSLVTTGEVLENTLLYSHEYPVYVVPEVSVYSLAQLATLLNQTHQEVVVGVGQSVINAGEVLKTAAGVRFIVKLTKIKPNAGASFVREDLLNVLRGYQAPLPNYTFEVEDIYPDYADLFGTSTGHAVIFDLADQLRTPKPAPPVTIKATVRNNGNIEIPLNLVVRVIDSQNQAVAVLRPSDVMNVPAGEARTVQLLWPNPPSQGTYTLTANVFADVYEGISKDSAPVSFQLLWMTIWINLLLLLIAAIVAIAIGHYSRKIGKGEKEGASIAKGIGEEVDKIAAGIEKRFRGNKK